MSGSIKFFKSCSDLVGRITVFASYDPIFGGHNRLSDLFKRYRIDEAFIHNGFKRSVRDSFKSIQTALGQKISYNKDEKNYVQEIFSSFPIIMDVDYDTLKKEALKICFLMLEKKNIDSLIHLNKIPIVVIEKTFYDICETTKVEDMPKSFSRGIGKILNCSSDELGITFIRQNNLLAKLVNFHFRNFWFENEFFEFPKGFFNYEGMQKRIEFVARKSQYLQQDLTPLMNNSSSNNELLKMASKIENYENAYKKMNQFLLRNSKSLKSLEALEIFPNVQSKDTVNKYLHPSMMSKDVSILEQVKQITTKTPRESMMEEVKEKSLPKKQKKPRVFLGTNPNKLGAVNTKIFEKKEEIAKAPTSEILVEKREEVKTPENISDTKMIVLPSIVKSESFSDSETSEVVISASFEEGVKIWKTDIDYVDKNVSTHDDIVVKENLPDKSSQKEDAIEDCEILEENNISGETIHVTPKKDISGETIHVTPKKDILSLDSTMENNLSQTQWLETTQEVHLKDTNEVKNIRKLLKPAMNILGHRIIFSHFLMRDKVIHLEEDIKKAEKLLKKLDSSKQKAMLANDIGVALNSMEMSHKAKDFFQIAMMEELSNEKHRIVCYNCLYNLFNISETLLAQTHIKNMLTNNIEMFFDSKRFSFLHVLGVGSLGFVFLCHDNTTNKDVALRMFWKKGNSQAIEYLESVKHIENERFAQVYDVQLGKKVCVVTEFFKAHNLREYILGVRKDKPLSIEEALAVIRDASRALHALHVNGKAHGNIRPTSILYQPKNQVIKITDVGCNHFSISPQWIKIAAKWKHLPKKHILREKVSEIEAYASLEQKNKGYATPNCDIFSLGKTLIFLVTSQYIPGDKIISLPKDIQEKIGDIIKSMLHPIPEKRYSALELIQKIDERIGKENTSQKIKEMLTSHIEINENVDSEEKIEQKKELQPPKDDVEMCHIAQGYFFMGAKEIYAKLDEQPQNKIYLSEYFMDKYPVTWGKYKEYLKDVYGWIKWRSYLPPLPSWKPKDDEPIVNISWEDARKYAYWAGKELPTEAQWEKAAKGGIYLDTEETEKNAMPRRSYPWGDNPPQINQNFRANFSQTDYYRTTSINQFPQGKSPYGCIGMAGNIMEWCLDWYAKDFYRKINLKNPTGSAKGKEKIARGGAWNTPALALKNTRRNHFPINHVSDNLGFRCVMNVSNDLE